MSKVFDSIKQGLNEAIEYEKGNLKAKSNKIFNCVCDVKKEYFPKLYAEEHKDKNEDIEFN